MNTHVSRLVAGLIVLACAASTATILHGQVTSRPVAKGSSGDYPSRWDIFIGYSYLAPKGTVNGTVYDNINIGVMGSVSRYFNKYVGLQFEGDTHDQSEDWNVKTQHADNSNDDFAGGALGVILRFPTHNITPFIHALGGGERVGSIYQLDTWGPMATAGGGLDLNTPLFHHHLAIRLAQVDYQYTTINFPAGQNGTFNIARYSAGGVYHLGAIMPPAPVQLSCYASPSSIFPGDPVTVTATAGQLNPKKTAVYTWSGTGVKGNGATASVATDTLAPGTYTVTGEVKEGSHPKPDQIADCSASFVVKAYEPPVVSCSASPTTIKPGETSTITASGISPQNRPLTYSYSAATGTIAGNGTTAVYSPEGVRTGPVAITCVVADDKGQTATASTSVTIVAPYVAPVPHTQAMCTAGFDRDAKRPTRVDNEAKACLDGIALELQKQSDAKIVVVGEATTAENSPKKTGKHTRIVVQNMAAQRAVNVKDYLVTEKGIDASRVSAQTRSADGQQVEDYLVPSGADFAADVPGTSPVDESVIKPQARNPLPARHAHRNRAAAPTAK